MCVSYHRFSCAPPTPWQDPAACECWYKVTQTSHTSCFCTPVKLCFFMCLCECVCAYVCLSLCASLSIFPCFLWQFDTYPLHIWIYTVSGGMNYYSELHTLISSCIVNISPLTSHHCLTFSPQLALCEFDHLSLSSYSPFNSIYLVSFPAPVHVVAHREVVNSFFSKQLKYCHTVFFSGVFAFICWHLFRGGKPKQWNNGLNQQSKPV